MNRNKMFFNESPSVQLSQSNAVANRNAVRSDLKDSRVAADLQFTGSLFTHIWCIKIEKLKEASLFLCTN